MAYQSVFKRYELKYLITEDQKAALLRAMEPHMALDRYGRTTIRNIYYDTDTYAGPSKDRSTRKSSGSEATRKPHPTAPFLSS